MAVFPLTLTETLKVFRADRSFVARPGVLRDVLIARGTLSRRYRVLITLSNRLRLPVTVGVGTLSRLALVSTLRLRSSLNTGVSARLRSTLNIHPSFSIAQATALRSTVRLTTSAAIQGVYRTALKNSLRLTAKGPTFSLRGFLTSRLALTSTLARTYRAVAALTNKVALTNVLNAKLVVVIVSQGRVNLTGTQALRGIYHSTLKDTVNFLIDVVDPGGGVTTWAMNIRTGAVTEYLNYNFNSFAQAPSGAYLGANKDGLFELVGQGDAGVPIVADLISGLAEFSGSFLSGFKAAYLGVRGGGQFYLKLTTGGGSSYVYGVQADYLRTARVNLGKGLRARYFTWELISTGQDFDLTDITFLPIQSTRRL